MEKLVPRFELMAVQDGLLIDLIQPVINPSPVRVHPGLSVLIEGEDSVTVWGARMVTISGKTEARSINLEQSSMRPRFQPADSSAVRFACESFIEGNRFLIAFSKLLLEIDASHRHVKIWDAFCVNVVENSVMAIPDGTAS